MGRLILQMQMTVDGFIASDEPDWQVWDWTGESQWDAALLAEFNATIESVGTILLGRPMVEGGYLQHWAETARARPHDPDYRFAQRIVDVEKVVVSRSLQSSRWPATTIDAGPVADTVQRIKLQDAGDIIAFGGVAFARSLLSDGLADELQLYINPTAVGTGEGLFTAPTPLALLASTSYPCGVVVQKYSPTGGSRAAQLDLQPAAEQLIRLVGGVRADQLALATPCPDYDVAALLDHLMGLTRVFTLAALKLDDAELSAEESGPGAATGDHLDPAWRDLLPERLTRLADAWTQAEAWQGDTQAGMPMSSARAGTVALDELVLHGWDLAAATDQHFDPLPAHVDAVSQFIASTDVPDNGIPRSALFSDPVPVDDETVWHQVLGAAGRDPNWAADV